MSSLQLAANFGGLSEYELSRCGITIKKIDASGQMPFAMWSLFRDGQLLRGCFSLPEALFFGRLYVNDDPTAAWTDEMASWYK